MQAVQIFCIDAFGSMLWDSGSQVPEQYFKSWNTCVKLVHGLTRSTFTYLVKGFLSGSQVSLWNQVLSRYPGFYRGLLNSPSKEGRILAKMVSSDPRSTTCRMKSMLVCLKKKFFLNASSSLSQASAFVLVDMQHSLIQFLNFVVTFLSLSHLINLNRRLHASLLIFFLSLPFFLSTLTMFVGVQCMNTSKFCNRISNLKCL